MSMVDVGVGLIAIGMGVMVIGVGLVIVAWAYGLYKDVKR